MTLAAFTNTPLSSATQIGSNDYFTGDGSTNTFLLINNTVTSLANTVESENAFYTRSDGGVTGTGASMTLSSPPAASAKIIAPNSNYGYISAFDRSVSGVSTPQVSSTIIHIADISDIETSIYTAAPTKSGILVYHTQRITGGGALPSWYNYAPLNTDMTINTGAWGSAGAQFTCPFDLQGASTLNGSVSAGDGSIVLTSAAQFTPGQWIKISDGSNSDIVWVNTIASNTLTLSQNLSYSHANGLFVYVCGTGLGVQLTVPSLVGGGIPINLFNLSLDAMYQALPR